MGQGLRLGLYAVSFLGLILISLFFPLSSVDYHLYRSLYLNADSEIQFKNEELLLIDLPGRSNNSDEELRKFRNRLADLLNTIASGEVRPKAVVLDYFFSSNEDGIEAVHAAIEVVASIGGPKYSKPVDVYRVIDLKESGVPLNKVLDKHNNKLYQNPSQYAHSIYNLTFDVLSYESYLSVPGVLGSHLIPALPIRVIHGENIDFSSLPREKVLALGDSDQIEEVTFSFVHEENQTERGRFVDSRENLVSADPGSFEKIIVIGSIHEDREFGDRSGPEIVLWALSDELSDRPVARQPLNNPVEIIAQIIGFGVLTIVCFALMFSYIKKLRTRPFVLAFISVAISLLVLFAYAAFVMSKGWVPPLALTIVSVVIGGVLCLNFAYKYLITGVAEGSDEYDVFISYSRSHSAWVIENVYKPLKEFKTADGKTLNIFFDRDKIGAGDAFTSKYMWAIVNSRTFLPVFSSDYSEKNHCKNEMDLAYKRYVEQQIHLLPVLCHSGAVPDIYSTLNYVDAVENADFMNTIKAAVISKS